MTILEVRGVERRFDKTLALQATDLSVAENEFITILGPSGCGKSTLLRIVAGLDTPTAGEVLLDGRRIGGPGADRGMVFQSYTLFPWLTVQENIVFGLREKGMAVPERDEISQVLDYRHLREMAIAEAEREHTHLLETLAGRIAQRALAMPGVAAARVRVAKPQVFADCDAVSVEVRVQRNDRGA